MATNTNRSTVRQVADSLYDHEWDEGRCKCGWTTTGTGSGTDDHCDHLASVLMERFDVKTWSYRPTFASTAGKDTPQ